MDRKKKRQHSVWVLFLNNTGTRDRFPRLSTVTCISSSGSLRLQPPSPPRQAPLTADQLLHHPARKAQHPLTVAFPIVSQDNVQSQLQLPSPIEHSHPAGKLQIHTQTYQIANIVRDCSSKANMNVNVYSTIDSVYLTCKLCLLITTIPAPEKYITYETYLLTELFNIQILPAFQQALNLNVSTQIQRGAFQLALKDTELQKNISTGFKPQRLHSESARHPKHPTTASSSLPALSHQDFTHCFVSNVWRRDQTISS